MFANLKPLIPELESKHENRFLKSADYDYLMEDIDEYKAAKKKEYISLNLDQRRKEKEELEEKRFQRENERRKTLGLKLLKKGETFKDTENSKDPELKETAHILADYIQLAVG